MALEIERKFLTGNEGWREHAIGVLKLHDGLLLAQDGRKLRVRIAGQVASITFKSNRFGITRTEFEYQIPLAEAEEMLRHECEGRCIEKSRYIVPHHNANWNVDVYGGIMSGIILAEIELSSEDQDISLPDWIGREVTGLPEFSKTYLFNARRAPAQAAMADEIAGT